ncbi:MAG: hypothetical protein GY944_13465 [bacterium]|nr:hypothetical protein [bacterium]
MTPHTRDGRVAGRPDDLSARTHAAALGVELRSPLAQIELAASQLYREALSPSARAQSEQIFEAVACVDELIERMLRVLVPSSRTLAGAGALAPVIADLRRRFAPALEACGVEWVGQRDRDIVARGDGDRVRVLTTELLRLALVLCGDAGHFELAVEEGQGELELILGTHRHEPLQDAGLAQARAAVERARAATLEGGGVLVGECGLQASVLRLAIQYLPSPDLEPRAKQEGPCLES